MAEALKEFEGASPQLDLIMTDIHMPEGDDPNPDDKSGILLKNYVKDRQPRLPVGCYTAHFSDNTLTDEELEGFDLMWGRGTHTSRQLDELTVEAVGVATLYRHREEALHDDLLFRLRSDYSIKVPEAEILRHLILDGSAGPVEGPLHDAGYRLRMLRASSDPIGSQPFVVWVNHNDEGVETEVYGFAKLYAFGADEPAALHELFEVMSLQHAHIRAGGGKSGRLGTFLSRVLG